MIFFYQKNKESISSFKGNNLNFPAHLHGEVEILLVEEGEIQATIGDRERSLTKGEISICLPQIIHSYKSGVSSRYLITLFSSNFLEFYKKIFIESIAEEPFVCQKDILSDATEYLNLIYKEISVSGDMGKVLGLLYLSVSHLLPVLQLKERGHNSDLDLIERAILYISNYYMTDLTLESIARGIHTSHYHLSREFAAKIGTRIDHHVNELRINYSDHLLKTTDKTITETALESGFNNLRTFNRVYKQIKGITAKEFRRRSR